MWKKLTWRLPFFCDMTSHGWVIGYGYFESTLCPYFQGSSVHFFMDISTFEYETIRCLETWLNERNFNCAAAKTPPESEVYKCAYEETRCTGLSSSASLCQLTWNVLIVRLDCLRKCCSTCNLNPLVESAVRSRWWHCGVPGSECTYRWERQILAAVQTITRTNTFRLSAGDLIQYRYERLSTE
jgi:hypothetical protein